MSQAEELPHIDHEAIRAVGETMAVNIGALAASNGENREAILATLNSHVDQVPYATLFEEDTRLAEALSAVDAKRQVIDSAFEGERSRLNNLVATVAAKQPENREAAKTAADQKISDAEQIAATQRAPLNTTHAELTGEQDQLTATVESVNMAWPVPPYSEEVRAIVAEKYPDSIAEDDDFEWDENEPMAGETEPVITKRVEPVQERVLGPYAALAERIPSLSDRLQHPVSEHVHVYGEIKTAKEVLDQAMAKPGAERTEEEDNLCRAVFVLRRRFLVDPDDLSFLEVYEAEDIFQLTKDLNKFSRKNRPDFNDLEGKILDKAASHVPLLGKDVPDDIQGATDRMRKDAPGRRGMTWHSLSKHASRACDTIRARLFAGGKGNIHLNKYIIEIGDRSGTKPNISWIYQFIADDFAFNVVAARRSTQQAIVEQRFNENCGVIENWLTEAQSLLDELPDGFRLQRYENQRGSRRFQRRNRKAVYENVVAATSITNTIRDIEIRRAGTRDSKAPRHKPMSLDPLGALNHQLRLGHMVDRLKDELAIYDAPTAGHTEEITPFE